jgi:hypothetical protein
MSQDFSLDSDNDKIGLRRLLTQSRESGRKGVSRPSSVINQIDLDNAVLYAKCRRRRELFKGSQWTGGLTSTNNHLKVNRSVSNYKNKRIKPFMNIKDIDTQMVGPRQLKRKTSETLVPVTFPGDSSTKTYYVSPALGESIIWYQKSAQEQMRLAKPSSSQEKYRTPNKKSINVIKEKVKRLDV